MIRNILLVILVLAAGGITYWWMNSETPDTFDTTVTIEEEPFYIEFADTPDSRTKGLSFRTDIEENYGMFFIFPEPGSYGFWMKDMRISIDIIWIAEDGTIVGIEDSVTPDTYPTAFYPPVPIPYVLETKAGEARRKGWEVGTVLPIPR
ncbi:DUF192 domain-containing protein [Patescibacteria group bacterium]|nr:DUF192 domain-containing protein [Patescibacteria group bacterium]